MFILSNVIINSVTSLESELENIILVLLANKIGVDILFILNGKSLIYNRKNSGPSVVTPVAVWYEFYKMQYEWKA